MSLIMWQQPHAEDIITEMKASKEKDVVYVKNLTRTQTAFYQPLPIDNNKDMIVRMIGSEHWDTYTHNFNQIDVIHITISIGYCKQ